MPTWCVFCQCRHAYCLSCCVWSENTRTHTQAHQCLHLCVVALLVLLGKLRVLLRKRRERMNNKTSARKETEARNDMKDTQADRQSGGQSAELPKSKGPPKREKGEEKRGDYECLVNAEHLSLAQLFALH